MLALIGGEQFLGVVGTKTTSKYIGTIVCVGDTVEAIDREGNKHIGVVIIHGVSVVLTGTFFHKIEQLRVTQIIQSHKDLSARSRTLGDNTIYALKMTGIKNIR